MNIAAFASPLKYNTSEKIRERKAAMNNNISVVENFFNMFNYFFRLLCKYSLKQFDNCIKIILIILIIAIQDNSITAIFHDTENGF
jgi:hypothetical protein